ncbi:MAG: CBS domain-containing protein [Acidiphilium sp.]|nr:CBS domain-containing protein [Acidiphilium sp.]MDD4935986.1 CBS domain-containing protein [Acidiphilium sp.]
MHINNIMTLSPITVGPNTTIADAGRIMLDQNLSALPVIDGKGALLGIVTDGDLLRRPELDTVPEIGWWRGFLAPETSAREFIKTRGRHVSEVMTAEVRTVTVDTSLNDAVAIMATQRIKQLPVVQGDTLVGLLNRRNILTALISKLLVVDDVVVSDEACATMIRNAIAQSKWAPKGAVSVAVKQGVATLAGSVFSDAERKALLVIAENTNGVKSVADDMLLVDPVSGLGYGSF